MYRISKKMNILAICVALAVSSAVSAIPQVQLGNTTLVGRAVAGLQQEFFGGQFPSSHSSFLNNGCSLGIPYAQPPVAELRFKPPMFMQSPGVSTFDASNFGFACLQPVQYISSCSLSCHVR